jgi:hypothetical protein
MVLMPREGYYIIRCPRCGRYTYAPTRQKTRLCVFCQRIFKIDPLNAVYIENADMARTRVKFYQTDKHHQDFMNAVEKSRESIQSLIPQESINLTELQQMETKIKPTSTRRRELEQILEQHARTTSIDLQILEQECQKAGIPWEWATQQIEMLIRAGHIIAPKPWQIRLVADKTGPVERKTQELSPTKLARTIGKIIRKSPKPISHAQLLEQMNKESISSVDVEEALMLLRLQGYILITSEGTYKWTAD